MTTEGSRTMKMIIPTIFIIFALFGPFSAMANLVPQYNQNCVYTSGSADPGEMIYGAFFPPGGSDPVAIYELGSENFHHAFSFTHSSSDCTFLPIDGVFTLSDLAIQYQGYDFFVLNKNYEKIALYRSHTLVFLGILPGVNPDLSTMQQTFLALLPVVSVVIGLSLVFAVITFFLDLFEAKNDRKKRQKIIK